MTTAKRFDYVVVGAGSAGAILAARLTEDAGISVLLIEAGGPDKHPLMLMPLAFPFISNNRRYIWRFESEPEPGLNGRRLSLRRGRTLGGSSSINGMVHSRGNPLDYDLWRQKGLDGWSYADVLPYFKKMESHWRGAGGCHGGDGPIGVTPVDYYGLIFDPIVKAAEAAGFPFCEDYNGAAQEGVSRMELTVRDGRRASTARAYLAAAMPRPNLQVITGALATRIIVERGRAIGVEYRRRGEQIEIHAEREVLLSGGAFNSPHLLMLSGIGPADELKAAGVTPLHDLPGVGRNLSEHPNARNVYRAKGTESFLRYLRFDRAGLAALQWFLFKSGPFVNNGSSANIFFRSRPELERPDLQLICVSVNPDAKLWFPGLTPPQVHRYAARGGILHPKSRGWVKLRSADPTAAPRIFFNMFAEKEDLDGMIRMIRVSRDIYSRPPLRDLIDCELFPGPEVTSDAALGDAIRASATHRSHPVGTCAMGTGPDAVVDARLRVYGIDGLRVVDASVMPDEPTGNTNVPTMMIGEKAADLIRFGHVAGTEA